MFFCERKPIFMDLRLVVLEDWKIQLSNGENYISVYFFFVGDMAFFLTGIIKRQNAMVEIFNKEQSMERIFDVKVLGMTFNQNNIWPGEKSRQCTVNNATTKSCYSILKSLRIFRRSADFKLRRSLAKSLVQSRINKLIKKKQQKWKEEQITA